MLCEIRWFLCDMLYLQFLSSSDAVVKHFEDFHEDQFDFHSYCIRKVTLRAYTDVLRWEDNLWGQPYYGEAAEGIIKIYLHIHDNPSITAEEAEADYASMSAAERKKAKALARKKKKGVDKKATEDAEQKSMKETVAVDAGATENGGKKKRPPLPEIIDEDPDGQILLKKDPLEEAKKFSAILSKNAVSRLSTWILQYDVASRRGKGLLALQALLKAKSLAPESSAVFARIVDLGSKFDSLISSEIVRAVFNAEVPRLLEGKDLENYVIFISEKLMADPLAALPMRVEVAKALLKIKKVSVADAANLIVDGGLSGRGVTVSSCREALVALTDLGQDAAGARSQWVAAVCTQFPLLQDFH